MRRKIVFIILIVFFLIFFVLLYYKNFYNGNTINKQIDIAENFLNNTNSYTAEIDVIINSNKNTINYKIRQEEKEKYSEEEILEGQNIEGLKLELKDNTLKITNTKLNLEKIYKDYNIVSNNSLFLSSFIKEYKEINNKTKIEENEDNIILKLEIAEDRYIKYKELYLDKKNGKPIKMLINNSYNKQTTSIIYTNIEIN
ncbi:MAG: hypothetical protein ACI4UE_02780 [Candidatus Scatovivens sp.]